MVIIRDRKSGMLYRSQRGYIEKVLRRFNMHDAEPVSTPLAVHFRLFLALCPVMMILSTCLDFHIRVQLVLSCIECC